jgi:hypothetical protein
MRANVDLNEDLLAEAFSYSHDIATKNGLLEVALQEYINTRKRRRFTALRGKIAFRDDYDYKAMR